MFQLISPFKITLAQKEAAEKLVSGVKKGYKHQTLLGVTGCGKTFVMANVINEVQLPILVLSPNKTLAAQLYEEFKSFFPKNAVHYFVSYYDYYQPEAYIPQTDTYIKKDVKINKEIDRLRHEAVQSVLSRNDVIIVASVSAIYNLGSPKTYQKAKLQFKTGQKIRKREILKRLIGLQYERNDYNFEPGKFRIRADFIDVWQPSGKFIYRIKNIGEEISELIKIEAPFSKESPVKSAELWPAKFWLSEKEKLKIALSNIRLELQERVIKLKSQKKFLEAERLKKRTLYDLSLIQEVGWCHGIENYSRHLEFRKPKKAPFTLLDYYSQHSDVIDKLASHFITFIDESHISVPQIKGMYEGDKARKEVLIKHGFRLPSCLDNRPLKFNEFLKKTNQIIYTSATPSLFERKKSIQVVEQLIRPTGLLDPEIKIKPTQNQIEDVIRQIQKRTKKGERVLVTTLTKRLAEAIADYLVSQGIKATFLHSEIKTLQRPRILRDLRQGKYDVLVGINLLREGLDLPEVSLIIILDADKESFLRDKTSLMQIMGRASRHINGQVVMYADKITGSMKKAIEEVKRRQDIQKRYNQKYHLVPSPITTEIKESLSPEEEILPKSDLLKDYLKELKNKLELAQRNLQFEKVALIKKEVQRIKAEK
ncbi:MAG: excinuclease ABC subunit B [Candidatus Nealsonbacteria bacterium CG_4_9_14_3_um_filter_35_11]|uniref:UvrABC system protein B n=2 Tax=Candidatus Nealsoniibacteriota TaxID=1817911 RepID=A0A2M7DB78_9BACT|nr:MAG: excinuclease ABC subunit B [Candidatus Nealsonbacteria bacterium CG11_big_fil_rev_8_21_14_0_20_35_11]PIV45719.1 MAG: excinuclease ABC subunit B [Candidatus Nealsonbacteria bacterium CG02_land_8_20_14_3_00_34_20]PJA84326.1 MAG: excinuclease ABC subunit B [Candidatus Nealsonbacteria bacterium CG_4_9_14_3_um_filter_35_11]